MKTSKKTQQYIQQLEEIQNQLGYFANNSDYLRQEIQEICAYIEELAIDKKIDHARFAKKLKFIWKKNEDV
jgi:prefoldin subunit 5